MKKLIFLFLVPVSLLVIFMAGGCKLDNPSNVHYTEFVMQIDSIFHPDTIRIGGTLPIRFYGTIGPDGCYSFSRFNGTLDGRNINITAYSKVSDEEVCTQQIQYLDGVTLSVNQLDTGRYIIQVHQASPPNIIDTVFVAGFAELK